jgi:hypothetical protein
MTRVEQALRWWSSPANDGAPVPRRHSEVLLTLGLIRLAPESATDPEHYTLTKAGVALLSPTKEPTDD